MRLGALYHVGDELIQRILAIKEGVASASWVLSLRTCVGLLLLVGVHVCT
jgi:hypothetical protein